MTKESHVFIRPPEKPSSTTVSSPALINLAVALGEFKAISGIEFDVIQHDRMHLRVTYWQDEAFIALRLKFGQWFVPDPTVKPQRPSMPTPPPLKPKQKKHPDWWQIDDETPVIWKRNPMEVSRIVQEANDRRRRRDSNTGIAEIIKKAEERVAEEAKTRDGKAKSALMRIVERYRK